MLTINPICQDFITQSILTWNRLQQSENTQIDLGEESITDINLIDLQVKHPNEIKTIKIPKRQEVRLGCDWEWYLGSGNDWLKLRVQAKKLHSANLVYLYLDYATERYGRQIDNLIEKSLRDGFLPIYIFYNYWNVSRFDPPWLCSHYHKDIPMLGCSVSSASSVRRKMNSKNYSLQDLSNIMYPWSCLVCCDNSRSLPYRTFDFLYKTFKEDTLVDDYYADNVEHYVTRNVPEYVRYLIEGKSIENEIKNIKVCKTTVIYEKKHI